MFKPQERISKTGSLLSPSIIMIMIMKMVNVIMVMMMMMMIMIIIPVIVLKELGCTVANATFKARCGIEKGSVSALTMMTVMMIMIIMMIIIKMCLPLMQKAMKCCHIEYNAAS
jgi:hypothetical protein